MTLHAKKIGWLLVAAAVLLSACGLAAEQEPTPDTVAIRTQAVETAMSEMTLQAMLNPTATLVPTNTLLPTATSSETTTTPQPVSGSGGGSGSGSGGSVSTRAPTAVVQKTWSTDEYWCQVLSEDPLEYAQPSGWNFDKTWKIRNIGTKSWNSATFSVVWVDGENWSYGITKYNLPHDVAPKETVDIVIDIQVPLGVTDKPRVTWWGISNNEGKVFCRFYHTIPSTYPPG